MSKIKAGAPVEVSPDQLSRIMDAGDELHMGCEALKSVISMLSHTTQNPDAERLYYLLRCVEEQLEKVKYMLRVV